MQVAGQGIRILFVLVAVLLLSASGGRAIAAQYSAIVMDMRDGTVLYESNADRRQAPASLTKMMTLYLAFEAVENGQIKLDQKVRVSRHAASQPASKLYLKAGQKVSIRSLIRASAIKSANDAAVALAEAIGGSEKAFAGLMTAKARQLGMANTTFKNANGLTSRGHLSTARDMATLGRHLFFDFPQYYNIFSRKTGRAAGKQVWTTNRLLSSYRGADGIKTGYTNAAGYNLVASAHRGDKRIVAALFGGKSSRSRNAQMVKLLNNGFARAGTRVAMVAPRGQQPVVARAPLPPAKPGAPATRLEILAQVLSSEAVAATPPSNSLMAPLYAVVPQARAERDRAPIRTVAVRGGNQMPIPVPRPSWAVQLGEFQNRAIAVARVREVSRGNVETLASAAPVIDEIRSRQGNSLYRVRFVGLAPDDADRACQRMKALGQGCTTMAPGT
ncbi:MAG TPA: serine hydrolase [Thermohalobaculum sp.]|nr:serine hydrolase [Thermohalobaculum sp.]